MIQEERAPTYLVIGRIIAVVGMSVAAAASILFLIGAFMMEALLAFLVVVPFALLMRLIEVTAARRSRRSA